MNLPDLYPVVQDLTEAEYGCCSSEMVFGSFTIQDLANPHSTRPLSSSSTFRNAAILDRENSLLDHHSNVRDNLDEMMIREHSCSRFEDRFVLTRQVGL